MILLEDTRNQPGKHKNIEAYCATQGIEIIRTKLLVGDYMLAGSTEETKGTTAGIKGDIVCDSKYGVPEIASKVFQEHERFRAECETAQKLGIQLIVLVEESLPFGRLDYWRSPIGRDGLPKYKFDPARLRKALVTMQDKYGVKFRFCDGRSTGRLLIEYLKGERA